MASKIYEFNNLQIDCKKENIIVFALCVCLYVFNRLTKFHEVDESVVKYIWDYNFTDFLCQIVYFSLCNLVLETINGTGLYRFRSIIAFSAICCTYWELGTLITQSDAVFDVADWIAYLLGATIYYALFVWIRTKKNARLLTVAGGKKNG